MSEIRSVKVELLRSGPAHNQLLSPLTPYLALCGAEGPVTVYLPFEHGQLLARLERLRYGIDGAVGSSQRQAELRELGESLGRVFSQVPALLSEISNARSGGTRLIHLQLSVTAYELALVPFELAIGSDAYPGSGAPLLIQSIAPVTLTREVRRGRPLPVTWNRQPKILFAFASPSMLPAVPAQEHLEALRRAVAPFVRWYAEEHRRIDEIQEHITVLPNASVQKIREACSSGAYTHVHILAHGELIQGRDQYGIALYNDSNPASHDLVDGHTLATALTVRTFSDEASSRPTVVTLATCDSGNVQSVVIAGGSIAHALHEAGIPWVVASQFPLWMKASSIAVEELYNGFFQGQDPRWVLHTLRQRLRSDSQLTHDWASIVAYAVTPSDFEKQVEGFRDRQTRQRIEVLFHEAEQLAKASFNPRHAAVYDDIRRVLEGWRGAAAKLGPKVHAERLGMSGASEKRLGILSHEQGDRPTAMSAYRAACDFYRRGFEVDPLNHWAVTQYLSMLAVLNSMKESSEQVDLSRDYGGWWSASRQITEWQLRGATGENRAWAFGTLAELELLGVVYAGAEFDITKTKNQIAKFCSDLVDIIGKDTFPVHSTRRQFLRYRDTWSNAYWKDLADTAIRALPHTELWAGRAYLGAPA